MTPTRNSKFKDEHSFLSTKTRIRSKIDKSEELISELLDKRSKSRRLESLYITKKDRPVPVVEKKESINDFTARFEKKIFCTLSAKEIEAIMYENRLKIEQRH